MFAVDEFGCCSGNTVPVSLRSVMGSSTAGPASCGSVVECPFPGNTHEPLSGVVTVAVSIHSTVLICIDSCRSGARATGVASSISGAVAIPSHIELV